MKTKEIKNANQIDTNVNGKISNMLLWLRKWYGKMYHYFQEQICPFPYKSILI